MPERFFFHYSQFFSRITPCLVVMIMIHIVMRDFGSGPMWNRVTQYFTKPCEQNWWSTIMYVQNYVHPMSDVSMFIITFFSLSSYLEKSFILNPTESSQLRVEVIKES